MFFRSSCSTTGIFLLECLFSNRKLNFAQTVSINQSDFLVFHHRNGICNIQFNIQSYTESSPIKFYPSSHICHIQMGCCSMFTDNILFNNSSKSASLCKSRHFQNFTTFRINTFFYPWLCYALYAYGTQLLLFSQPISHHTGIKLLLYPSL